MCEKRTNDWVGTYREIPFHLTLAENVEPFVRMNPFYNLAYSWNQSVMHDGL